MEMVETLPPRVVWSVPSAVRAEVLEWDYRRQLDGGDPLDSHLMLQRLKVAAGLALLDDRIGSVKELDWVLAGWLVDVSRSERSRLVREVAESRRASARTTGELRAVTEMAASDARVRVVADNLLRKFQGNGGSGKRSEMRKKLRLGSSRDMFDDAIELLIADGSLIATDGGWQCTP
jgi:hypothetical protein